MGRDNRVARKQLQPKNQRVKARRNKGQLPEGAVTSEDEENIPQARQEDCSSAVGDRKSNSWFFHWTTRFRRLDVLESSVTSET
jgi:hypothetical protein